MHYSSNSTILAPNNTVYAEMAKLDLSGLRVLSMEDMDLDCSQVELIGGWKLPKLEVLKLGNNFITDDCMINWITAEALPNIKALHLGTNNLKAPFIHHISTLAGQSTTSLKLLDISRNKLSDNIAVPLSLLHGL